jgi:hypothetical protein
MGARHQRWLIARGNVFLPSTAAVAKFVERLRTEKWIGSGGEAHRTVEADSDASPKEAQPSAMTKDWLDDPDREEIRLVWEGGRSPLSQSAARFSLEVHRAPEYVYPRAKSIGKLPTKCACGEDLSFEWDADEVTPAFESSTGIFAECEECSRTFDPSKGTATITSHDGSKNDVPGGAAYRFAVVAVGDDVEGDAKIAPELVALVENEFGRAFYEVGS